MVGGGSINHQDSSTSQETVRAEQAEPFKEGAMKCTCPAQVLVIDRVDGPADVLTDLIARLFEGKVSVMQANNYEVALYALHGAALHMVILGYETNGLDQLSVLLVLRKD